jgi:hypothetical protein
LCSLELPIFDSELAEMRCFLFFRLFEDQLESVKLVPKAATDLDPGSVLGQWYELETKTPETNGKIPTGARSSVSGRSTVNVSPPKVRGNPPKSSYFFLGLVIDGADHKRRMAPNSAKALATPPTATATAASLVPLVLAAHSTDLLALCDDFADIALKMDESSKMAQSEVEADAAPPAREQAAEAAKGKKKPPPKPVKTPEAPELGPLHRQAEAIAKRAEVQWGVAVSKAELVVAKSNRILAGLMNQKDRCPPDVRFSGMEIASAGALSRFFNIDYGICETAPQIAEWFASSWSSPQVSAPPSSKS